MGSTDNAAASTAAKVSSNAGTGFGNSSGGEFDTSPTPSSGLSGSVGIGGANAPSDIFQVSSALTSNGLMDAPQNTADSTLYSGIISAQESMGSDLKRDGLVNPNGPTQQTFNKLSDQGFVKAPAPAAPPPPLPPLPQGEGRGEGSSTATILSDETIQSNQRLADSLKKRAGVGDLPKFTSDAINTDGDKAIPEIVNLLHEVEDPAQARELYQRTLDGITPEHQEQFEDAYTLSLSGSTDNGDGSHQLSDDETKDFSIQQPAKDTDGNEVLSMSAEQNNDDGSHVEVAQASQPNPSQQPKAPPPSDPRFNSINWAFINKQEGFSLDGEPPFNTKAGKVAGKSGATFGAGVNVGQMNDHDLNQLVKKQGLSPQLAAKLRPYLGVKRKAAQALLAKKPIILTKQEAIELTHAKHADTMDKLSANVDRLRGAKGSFDKLPDAVKTVYYDLAVHEGPNFLAGAPNMTKHLQNGDVKGMVQELKNYYRDPATPGYLTDRRRNEAIELENALKAGTLKPRF